MIELDAPGPAGDVRALVSTVGAGLHGLWVGARTVMPEDSAQSRSRWYSGQTLAPWPNRLRDGSWQSGGRALRAPVNDGLGNAIHGLVAEREFSVARQERDTVVLECELGADAVYPFAVTVRVTFAVDAHGLTCTLGACNRSDQRVPFAIGMHPYFPFDDDTTLTIGARRGFEVDDRLLPTGRMRDLAAWGVVGNEPTSLSRFAADDCFTDHARDAAGRAHTVLTYSDGSCTDVWQGPGLDFTVIFVTREFEWPDGNRHAIAIEPQTSPTDALNSGEGLLWLDPAAECAVQWGITHRSAQAEGSALG